MQGCTRKNIFRFIIQNFKGKTDSTKQSRFYKKFMHFKWHREFKKLLQIFMYYYELAFIICLLKEE